MRSFFICITLISFQGLHAQLKNLSDNIRQDLKGEKSAFIGLDGKNSIVRDVPIKLFGLQGGYCYNERTNLFVGFYKSHNKEVVVNNPTAKSGTTDSNSIFQQYKLTYLNVGCEYYFHNSEHWRFSIPLGLGLGVGKDIMRNTKTELRNQRMGIMPIEIGFLANYKLTWWVWLSAGMGTRLSIGSNNFTGSYYTFGLSFRYGEIYRRTKRLIESQ